VKPHFMMNTIKLALPFALLAVMANTGAYGSGGDVSASSADYTKAVAKPASDYSDPVRNPDFERGKAYWVLAKYNGGQAKFSMDTLQAIEGRSSALVSVQHTNGEYRDVQLLQPLPVQPLTEYHISFKAVVPDTAQIRLSISNDAGILWSADIVLVPGRQSYGPFRYFSDWDDPSSVLAFQLGRCPKDLLLDAVRTTVNNAALVYRKQAAGSGLNINPLPTGALHLEIPFAHVDQVPVVVTDAHGKLMAADVIPPGYTGLEIALPSQPGITRPAELVFLVYIGERVVTQRIVAGTLLPESSMR
jgi:hypothetical protein